MSRALLGLTLFLCACGGGGARRPDVILVVVDTLRADRLSCYGHPRPTSPVIDRLADEGVLFEDATAQFSWTVPSMVSLMSGRYVTDRREILVPEIPTLAETLRDAGYRTFASVANQLLDEKGGFARGFEHYDAGPSERGHRRSDPERSRDLDELVADLEAPLAAALAEEGAARAPFFVYLHPFEPHDPYWPRRRFEDELPLDGSLPAWPTPWHLEELARDGTTPDEPERFAALHRYRAQYEHEVRYLDEQLGDALEQFRALGLLEHAVVALVSDHGEGLWDHRSPVDERTPLAQPGEFFYGEHGAHLYREAIETPFVLWGAGVPAGVRVSAAVENVDLVPTLLELTDVAPPAGLHGRSLLALARGAGDGRPFVFSYGSDGRATVRETATDLKLILETEGRRLLYDLGADPLEREDLASARPEDVERLHATFLDWQERHGGGEVDPDLLRDDLEALERLRRLGYTDTDIGR